MSAEWADNVVSFYSYVRHLFYERRLGNMIVALSSNTPGQVVQVLLPVARLFQIEKATN